MSEPLRRPSYKQIGDTFSPAKRQVVDVYCYHCGKTTRIAGVSIIDSAVSFWQERHDRLLGSLNEVVARCHLVHGTDPMREDFMRWLISIRESHNLDNEGEGWKSARKSDQ